MTAEPSGPIPIEPAEAELANIRAAFLAGGAPHAIRVFATTYGVPMLEASALIAEILPAPPRTIAREVAGSAERERLEGIPWSSEREPPSVDQVEQLVAAYKEGGAALVTETLARLSVIDLEAARLLVRTALDVEPEVPEDIARKRANILGIDWTQAAVEMSQVYPGPTGPELPDSGEEGPSGGWGEPPGHPGGSSSGPPGPRRGPGRPPSRGGPRA